jgi:hypothetical protein
VIKLLTDGCHFQVILFEEVLSWKAAVYVSKEIGHCSSYITLYPYGILVKLVK